ncbi:LOW QUALITY PROTEIN: DSBA-like thioredoxin domain-containing protein [Colletotrichum tofieldiae]|nr:LOW QUALITY PROTEIN: DSBA-like thioredoxin domain-containing protein [Colletotrichum tofieldiae]
MGGKVDAYIDIVLLGAINAASAKAKYGNFDARRSSVRVGKPDITTPDSFMERSMTVLPCVSCTSSKPTTRTPYGLALVPPLLLGTAECQPYQADVLAKTLADALDSTQGHQGQAVQRGGREEDLGGAATQEIKDSVKAKTQEAIERGAFGAPWFWVVNDEGKGEPFFGSDRFHYMYEYLGVPYQDIAILPPQGKSAKL